MSQSTVDSNNLNKQGTFKIFLYEQEENGKITEKGKVKRKVFAEADAMAKGKMESISIKLEPNREIEEMTH